jgi:hypothetical protein
MMACAAAPETSCGTIACETKPNAPSGKRGKDRQTRVVRSCNREPEDPVADAFRLAGPRTACCLLRIRSVDPGPQECPDLLGGLGCLRGTECALVDVGQAVANLKGDLDSGFGGCCG